MDREGPEGWRGGGCVFIWKRGIRWPVTGADTRTLGGNRREAGLPGCRQPGEGGSGQGPTNAKDRCASLGAGDPVFRGPAAQGLRLGASTGTGRSHGTWDDLRPRCQLSHAGLASLTTALQGSLWMTGLLLLAKPGRPPSGDCPRPRAEGPGPRVMEQSGAAP